MITHHKPPLKPINGPNYKEFSDWAESTWQECYAETIEAGRLSLRTNQAGIIRVTIGNRVLYKGRIFKEAAKAYENAWKNPETSD